MSALDAVDALTADATRSARRTPRRWLRRYGLAVLGAAVIVAWVARRRSLAPWIAPYPPDAVNVAGRLAAAIS